MKMGIIVFDTETTGLTPFCSGGSDEILQLAMINGEGKVVFNERVRPSGKTSWYYAEQIHGISPSDVEHLPGINVYVPAIQQLFDEANLVVAYNYPFDERFLRSVGVNIGHIPYFDVMIAHARRYGKTNLAKCASFHGFHGHNAHDALGDVLATLHCYKRLKNIL
jgi:DNA polymerase-3 subunit epsilon